MLNLPIETHPLDFNPEPQVASTRAHARYNRLLEMAAAGEEVPAEELERYREAAYGRMH